MLIRDKHFCIGGIIYTSRCRYKIPRLEKKIVDDYKRFEEKDYCHLQGIIVNGSYSTIF